MSMNMSTKILPTTTELLPRCSACCAASLQDSLHINHKIHPHLNHGKKFKTTGETVTGETVAWSTWTLQVKPWNHFETCFHSMGQQHLTGTRLLAICMNAHVLGSPTQFCSAFHT